MLTNGQAGMGYSSEDYVPNIPLRIDNTHNIEVYDSNNRWLATFRNKTDADRYIIDITNRVKQMRKGLK